MDGYGSLSTASAVTILALVGLLVVASAVALVPFDRSLADPYAGGSWAPWRRSGRWRPLPSR